MSIKMHHMVRLAGLLSLRSARTQRRESRRTEYLELERLPRGRFSRTRRLATDRNGTSLLRRGRHITSSTLNIPDTLTRGTPLMDSSFVPRTIENQAPAHGWLPGRATVPMGRPPGPQRRSQSLCGYRLEFRASASHSRLQSGLLSNTAVNSSLPSSAIRPSTRLAICGAGSTGYCRKSSKYQRISSRSCGGIPSSNRASALRRRPSPSSSRSTTWPDRTNRCTIRNVVTTPNPPGDPGDIRSHLLQESIVSHRHQHMIRPVSTGLPKHLVSREPGRRTGQNDDLRN